MSGKYALIIGNTEYIDPGLAQLTAPGKDAEDFARVLRDEKLCGFDEVRVLLNQLSSTVIEAVDEFFDQKKPDDLLVLYFSGHGLRDELGSLYLAFKNTIRSRLRSTAIKDEYIRGAMDQSRSKRQVVILDCCNSGAFPQGTKAEVGGTMGLTQAFQGYGRFVLTASDSTQFAWEGDKVIGETDNSLFTHFLVKGLEGEADKDGDGKITVDELYDYTYDQISKVTAKQTPTKSASKVEGEIVLRQFTRLEDIKPVALPDDLLGEIEDTRPYVREAAVQKLEKILKGKNIGLVRSAVEALEKIMADENTTRRVAQLATQVLDSYRQVEQKAEAERKAKEEAEHQALLKAQEERLAREKAEAEQKAKEEAEKLARAKAEREAAEREALRLKAERETAELAAREATEKAAIEKAEREAAERAAKRRAEQDALQLAARKKAEREQAEQAEREALELAARRKQERELAENTKIPAATKSVLSKSLRNWVIASMVGLCVLVGGGWGLSKLLIAPVVTPSLTQSFVTQPPAIQPFSTSANATNTPIGDPILPVGIVLPTKDEPRWVQDETRFQDLISKAGYDVQILFSEGDSAKEKANVEALIVQGIKVLIICPQDASAAAAAADEAHAAGVKVISYDRLIRDTASVDYYVNFDSMEVGAQQAQYLIDHATGTGNPIYLYTGGAFDNHAFLFFEGAWEKLQPKIADGTFVIKNSSQAVSLQSNATLTRDQEAQIIGQITTNWDVNMAKNLAESNLTVASAADKDVRSYVVTGQDAEIASIQYIIDGKQSMTVFKDVRTLAKDAITAAIVYLNGQTPEQTKTYNNGIINVPAKPSAVITVDRSNVKSVLIDSGYYQASDFTGLP